MKQYLFIVISLLASNITYAAEPPNIAEPDVTTLAQTYITSHDSNGDGRISIDEYQDWAAIQQRMPKLAAMALKWFDETDTNHDGYLSQQEVQADFKNLANR